MAQFYGDGRVLPEWPAADLDRLVRATLATLVSCDHLVAATLVMETWNRLDVPIAAAVEDCVLLHRHAVGDRR